MAKKRMGKGLSALIPSDVEESILHEVSQPASREAESDHSTLVEIKEIIPSESQARKDFNSKKLEELANSIKEHGILQPLLVRRNKEHYELIAGERRLRAAKSAGLKSVPVILVQADNDKAAEMGLIENLQREDLNVMEEAAAFHDMMSLYGHTQESLAKTISKSRSYVANSLRLLSLDPATKKLIEDGKLSAGHGRALLTVKSNLRRDQLREHILKNHLSVRQAESMANDMNEIHGKKKEPNKPDIDPFYRYIENKLRDRFQTKIKISGDDHGGKIEMSYHNKEELERLLDMMIEMEK